MAELTFPVSRRLTTDSFRAPLKERGDDLNETPPQAVRALLKAEILPQVIWEPACGPGSIARVLREAGHAVFASDLVDYHWPGQNAAGWDFLMERQCPPGIEAIVSNPPYKLAVPFVARALHLCPRVVMLLRLAFLEGTSPERTRILEDCGLVRVHVFRNRLPAMHRPDWNGVKHPRVRLALAWFVFERDFYGKPEINRISWVEEL